MPLTARCKECGYILYEKKSLRIVIGPREIMGMHNWECPKCKRKLEIPSLGDVVVLAVPEFEFPRRKTNESR